MFFQDLTPESILEEIWYGSWGLHLIRAPIRCTYLRFSKKNLVRLDQSYFSTQLEPNNTQQVIPCQMEHSATSPKQEDLVDMIQARLPSTRGLLMRMGTTSLGLDRREQGGLPRVDPLGQKAWARRPATEAV
jgi:hypothetical protein